MEHFPAGFFPVLLTLSIPQDGSGILSVVFPPTI